MRLDRWAVLALLIGTVLIPGRSLAQDDAALLRDGVFARDRNVSVEERPQPAYAPVAMHLGAFDVLPSITGSVEANDNIYAASSGATSDTIFRANPGITAKSTWSRHALAAFASLNASGFAAHPDQDTTDYRAGLDGRLDAHHDAGLAAGARFERDTEARTETASLTAINGMIARPIRYDAARAYLEGAYASNRFRVSGRVHLDDYRFDNARTLSGASIYQADRDHTVWTEGARVELALSPGTSVFALATLNQRTYRNPAPGEALRNSHGYDLQAGASFDLVQMARGEVALGYLDQRYNASLYRRAAGLSVNGRVEWFPTQLTTVSLAARRAAEDSGIAGVGGYTAATVEGRIDHELLRNLILSAGATYGRDAYNGYDRTDRREGGFVGALYRMNRAVTLRLTFNRFNQTSDGLNRVASFEVKRLTVALSYAF